MKFTELKIAALEHCNTLISKRISTIQDALVRIEESRNNESKSSVGDKYETGRAMMQMEEAKNQAQLSEALEAKQLLATIKPERKNNKADLGSLVVTSQGIYFIAVGIGKIIIKGQTLYAISIDAPIGKILNNKQKGDKITFSNRQIVIDSIY